MNLTGVAYTDTEIEIFWEPETDDVAVVEYQFYRDYLLVDTRDGLSFYQNFLTPDTTYVYSVQAVDSDAQTGAASTITLQTHATQAVINAGNAMEVLEYMAGAAIGFPYQDLRSIVETDKTVGLTLVSSEYNPDSSSTNYLYECDLGRTYLYPGLI